MVWKIGTVAGIVAGVVLGTFFGVIESITGEKVYTLLLNIDFFPVLGEVSWSETVEWLFHLFISWLIGILFAYWSVKKISKLKRAVAFLLTGIAAISYFPLSFLSKKAVPAITDWEAVFYWTAGHIIYAVILYHSAALTAVGLGRKRN